MKQLNLDPKNCSLSQELRHADATLQILQLSLNVLCNDCVLGVLCVYVLLLAHEIDTLDAHAGRPESTASEYELIIACIVSQAAYNWSGLSLVPRPSSTPYSKIKY